MLPLWVKKDFFNDPFFKDWWADFDVPMAAFNRQNSGKISVHDN